MVSALMTKLIELIHKYKIIFFYILFLILILIMVINQHESKIRYYIVAKFVDSGPLHNNMPVYYKGYKIGKIRSIILSDDYKYTYVKIIFFPKKPKLTEGTIAKVKKLDNEEDYIDLVASEAPNEKMLKRGSIIDGEPVFDLDSFISDIADSGLVIPLIETFSDSLTNLGEASSEIKSFFSESRLIIGDNRQNIKETARNLAQTTKSLNKITSRLNKSLTDDKLNNTTSNIDKSSTNILAATENIKSITNSIDSATKNLDKTMDKIDCTISKANTVASNIKIITDGIKCALGKRFGGLRIIFGKSINRSCSK